jgi:ribonuclease D
MITRDVLVLRGDLTDDLFNAIKRAGRVAWDIETSGLDWRCDRIGTCQLHADGVGTVVVQLADFVPDRLRDLLADAGILKVFHHAPFDLRFMTASWKTSAAALACTKIASKLLEPSVPPQEHSLQSLLGRHLTVKIEKGAVRTSDWTHSTLSEQQVAYAAADVQYLLPLLESLEGRLTSVGLHDLYRACLQHLPTRVELEVGGWPDVYAY